MFILQQVTLLMCSLGLHIRLVAVLSKYNLRRGGILHAFMLMVYKIIYQGHGGGRVRQAGSTPE
jgi:hypothetical protein